MQIPLGAGMSYRLQNPSLASYASLITCCLAKQVCECVLLVTHPWDCGLNGPVCGNGAVAFNSFSFMGRCIPVWARNRKLNNLLPFCQCKILAFCATQYYSKACNRPAGPSCGCHALPPISVKCLSCSRELQWIKTNKSLLTLYAR